MEAGKAARLQGWGTAILRIVTGVVFLLHAGNKLFYIYDYTAVAAALGQPRSWLTVLAPKAASLAEVLCATALVFGLFTRWVCIPLALLMLLDVLFINLPHGFPLQDNGFEYALLRLAASCSLVLSGPGAIALDNVPALRKRSMLPRLLRRTHLSEE